MRDTVKKKKKSKIEVFSVMLLKWQLARDFTLVNAHKYDMLLSLFDYLSWHSHSTPSYT